METQVDTDAEAYLPQTYVPGDNERISLYRARSDTKGDRNY